MNENLITPGEAIKIAQSYGAKVRSKTTIRNWADKFGIGEVVVTSPEARIGKNQGNPRRFMIKKKELIELLERGGHERGN